MLDLDSFEGTWNGRILVAFITRLVVLLAPESRNYDPQGFLQHPGTDRNGQEEHSTTLFGKTWGTWKWVTFIARLTF